MLAAWSRRVGAREGRTSESARFRPVGGGPPPWCDDDDDEDDAVPEEVAEERALLGLLLRGGV
jgi:hypothetical protein